MRWPDWLYTLTDVRDQWFTPDKEAHAFGVLALYAHLRTLAGLSEPLAVVLVVAAVLAVEVWELTRWLRLTPEQRANLELGRVRWPWMTDRASLKDVLVGLAALALDVQLFRWLT